MFDCRFSAGACGAIAFALTVTVLAAGTPGPASTARERPPRSGAPAPVASTDTARALAATAGRAPLAFERYEDGDGRPRYRARGVGYGVEVGGGDVVLGLAAPALPGGTAPAPRQAAVPDGDTRYDTVRLTLVGGRPADPVGAGPLDAVVNYLVGSDPAGWRLGVPLVGRVVVPEVYPGIDVVYYGNRGRLQYDFVVHPGADPASIRLSLDGADEVALTGAGDLELRVGDHGVLVRAPILYQDIGGARRPVDGRFVIDQTTGHVGFEVREFDRAHALVIDPVLDYGTYFASAGTNTDARGVGVDTSGNIYFGGTTNGAFAAGAKPLGSFTAGTDAYVAKFTAAGQPVFTTYFGGSGADRVAAFAVTSAGEVVIGGQTSSANLPGAGNPAFFDSSFAPGSGSTNPTDGFLARFSSTGALAWMSYVGGNEGANSAEEVNEVAFDASGSVIVAGSIVGFPGPVDGVQTSPGGLGDLLVVKFSSTGARLAATWLGTNAREEVNGLAVHGPSGDVVVSGITFSTQFPTTAGSYQPTCTGVVGQGVECAYLVRLSGDLKALRFSTYFGTSPFGAYIDGIAVDADNTLVLTGGIQAGVIAATVGDTTHNGGTDAFLARMTGDGATLSMLTYLGGAQFDAGASVAIDTGGQIYVAGGTSSTAFPVSQGALRTQLGGSQDGFLAKFLPDGAAVTHATLIGSAGFDFVPAVTVTPPGYVFLVGQAGGTGLAVTANAFDPSFSQGVGEAFLYRLSPEFDSEFAVPFTGPTTMPDPVILGAGTVTLPVNLDFALANEAGTLDRVEVSLYVTHLNRGDLRFTLQGPTVGARPTSTLLSRTGGSGDNIGVSCSTPLTLTDSADSGGQLPLTGSVSGEWRPTSPLNVFSGLSGAALNGTWTLTGVDEARNSIVGAIQCATVHLHFRRPTITSVTPGGSGVPPTGSVITIAGSGFVAGASVRVGGLPAAVRDTTSTLVSAVMPAGVSGAPHVAVTNPDGRSAFAVDPFNRVSFTRSKLGSQRQGEAGFSDLATLQPALSRNGRWLAFKSFATLMVNGDTNNQPDIFVRDRGTGGTRIVRVSMGLDGQQANGPSDRPRISADGRYVAFVSAATNLVIGDTNGQPDVFVHDRDADADDRFDEAGATRTFRVSVASTGGQASGPSADPDMSPDGFWVAFTSTAANLVPGDTNAVQDVFLHHWPSGQTERVSVATGGGQANRASFSPGVSAGGRRVVFSSDATNLVAGDGNGVRDVFLHERGDGSTVRVSTAAGSTADANGASDNPSIDDRGLTIAFETRATNITPALAGQAVVRSQVVVMRLPAVTPFDEIRAAADGRVGLAVVDIGEAIRNLLSGTASGQPGNGDSSDPEINGDGSGVAFESDSTDITSDDTNGVQDVFVASTSGGDEPERVSVDEQDQQGDEPSQEAALSDDGSAVAFESEAGLTSNTEGTDFTNVFVRGNKLLIDTIAPNALPLSGGDRTIRITGAGFVNPVQLRIGGVSAPVTSESSTEIVATAPVASTAGPVNLAISNSDGETTTAINAFTYLASGTDSDQDGLPDDFELLYGLDHTSGAGQDGAGGDPDGDGVTNAEEFSRGTHPKGSFQRFLAEGAVTDFFTTRISLANPSDVQTVTALLRFQRSNGTELSRAVPLAPRQSKKITVNQVPGMVPSEFATLVESDGLLVVDRQMWWDNQNAYGTHAEGAVRAPALTWYLAEGATHSGFDLFYLLQNPSPTSAAQVRVRYLLPSGSPLEKTYSVPAGSRFNIWVDQEQFPDGSGVLALSNTDVSAVLEVTNGVPVIVERAMYLSRGGQLFTAGHESAGVNAPALNWFLAEGATGSTFDMFVLLANPNPTAAVATVSYLVENGPVLTRTVTVPPTSRQNIWVDFDTPDGTTGFPLQNVALSTKVEVTNGVPIIVERAMWWPTDVTRWYEAHNSPGSTVTGTLWGLAEGVVLGPPSNTATYILVANTSAQPASVAVTLLFDGPAPVSRNFTVSANSRKTLDIGFEFPEAQGREFGALVESLGGTPAQIVVERALYNDALGQVWAGGNNQLATRLR